MNIKDLILPLSLAVLVALAFQYFFFKPDLLQQGAVSSGQRFIAPQSKEELKPLNTEVDFLDKKRPFPSTFSEVETDNMRLVFSSDAASLDRLEFKCKMNSDVNTIDTVFPVSDTEREDRCFLVAFNEKTPYYYKLINRNDTDKTTQLTYQALFDGGIIEKQFTVYKDTYQLDLTVNIKTKDDFVGSVEPRIFYPSPIMADIVSTDVISAIMNNEKGGIRKISRGKVDLNEGWYSPTLFGSDDRYFIHAMVQDKDIFTQRAYYRLSGHKKLFSILEGPTIKEPKSWTISFYFGPKELKALANVDSRLEGTLDYAGWLSPIAKFFLMILKFLFRYLKNYGWAIIVLTVLIKLFLLPFTLKGESGAKKKQAELQKKMRYVEQRYKHDRERLAKEKSELIRKHGLPGLGGCLPLIIQLPIFFVLSRVLSSSIELYKAPFLWISNLSGSDPYYIFPALIGVTMMAQAFFADDMKQRVPLMVTSLLLVFVSMSFAAGLALYIFVSTLLTVVQSIIQKKLKAA